MEFKLKPVNGPVEPDDGHRVLIGRLRHGGDALYDELIKDLAPSTSLRRFLSAAPKANRPEFAERYEAELRVSPATRGAVEKWLQQGVSAVTLLIDSSDEAHDPGTVAKNVFESYL